MTSPSSTTFRTSPVEIIRSGCDIWRTACGKKSIRGEARSRINCRNSMLFFVPQVRMVIDVELKLGGVVQNPRKHYSRRTEESYTH